MTDALEQELRSALAERAAAMPPGARERLAVVDYKHRGPSTLRRPTVVLVATLTVVALLAAVLIPSLRTPVRQPDIPPAAASIPAAFVGWTPAPGKATASRTAKDVKRCMWAAAHRARLGSPLVTDVRGPYVALLFVDERDNYDRFCIYGPHIGLQGSSQLRSHLPFESPAAQHGIQHDSWGGSCDPATGRAVGEMYGEVSRDVTAATFLFPDHRVEASLRHGFFLVWWPWAVRPAGIVLQTTHGTRSITLARRGIQNWCRLPARP